MMQMKIHIKPHIKRLWVLIANLISKIVGATFTFGKRNNYVIVAILTVIALAGVGFWLAHEKFSSAEGWQEFGMHLLVAMLEVLLAVFLIERLLARHDERKLEPIRLAIYDDAVLLQNNIMMFFSELYQISGVHTPTASVAELFSPAIFDEMFKNTYLHAKKTPQMNCATWVYHSVSLIRNRAETILNRYPGMLTPKFHKIVHEIANNMMLMSLSQAVRMPNAHVLQVCSPKPDDLYLEHFRALHAWCAEERALLPKSELLRKVEDKSTQTPNPSAIAKIPANVTLYNAQYIPYSKGSSPFDP